MFILQNDKTTKRQNVRNVKIKNQSFTLLEIVFTITIIGILRAICLPVMSAIKLSAQKLKDVSNLKAIAAAWRECAIERGWDIDSFDRKGTRGYQQIIFIEQLAGLGKTSPSDMVLNDPYIYISPGDKYASKVLKETICRFEDGVIDDNGPCFSNVSNALFTREESISYCLIINLPSDAPAATTPLAFTRGLCTDGAWDEQAGLYGSKGGYVVFCDGHVTWFGGDKPAKFLKWDQSGYTSNICEAVPLSLPQMRIGCAGWAAYRGKNPNVITFVE
ncbi:MAG: type II secretion system GspH family protein [Puniceicoccales bacterium]|jgi:prepilin-type processing-associated H-X9-DG protein|nr:type II secretion system GspH family protein [Puniceicoccales bacterium]